MHTCGATSKRPMKGMEATPALETPEGVKNVAITARQVGGKQVFGWLTTMHGTLLGQNKELVQYCWVTACTKRGTRKRWQ